MKTIFTSNSVKDELIEQVKKVLETEKEVSIAFNVIGRTMHQMLAEQLAQKMPEYNFDIEYNYHCVVSK